ncbi:MAG: hypothetical protein WCJ23_08770, partial [Verrucomicrobiota bacterium]
REKSPLRKIFLQLFQPVASDPSFQQAIQPSPQTLVPNPTGGTSSASGNESTQAPHEGKKKK